MPVARARFEVCAAHALLSEGVSTNEIDAECHSFCDCGFVEWVN